MAKIADRVQETTNTTGTGTLTLAGAVAGYRTFAQAVTDTDFASGDTVEYVILSGTDWEVGRGVYTSAGTTLTRVTVDRSNNAGAKISVAAGAFVWCNAPASLLRTPLNNIAAATGSVTIASGNNTGIVWNWASTTNTTIALSLGETTAATNGTSTSGVPNQAVLKLSTLAASTQSPLTVYSRGNHVFSVSPSTSQILLTDGSQSAPSLSFASSTNSGISWDGASAIQFSRAGNLALVLQNNGQALFPAGAANNPSVTDQNSSSGGLFWPDTTTLGITAANSAVAYFKSKHIVHKGTAPTITTGGGTSPSIVGRDEAFAVTIGTGGIATSFEVTFNVAFTTNAPVCVACSDTDIVALKVQPLTNKVTITATAPFTAGSIVNVICRGWE